MGVQEQTSYHDEMIFVLKREYYRMKINFQDASYRLHGRVVKGVGHLGHDEVMEAL